MEKIKEITAIETFPVRHPVLRPSKPIEACNFDGDNLTTTKHFGYFKNNLLVGVISLLESSNKYFFNKKQYQIRGMAVLDECQKKGIGQSLVLYTEAYLRDKKDIIIWFNARKSAVGFYQKLGYTIIGDSFEIEDAGTHFVMFKNMDN